MPRAKEIFPRAGLGTRAIGTVAPPISFPFVYFSKVSYVCLSHCIVTSSRSLFIQLSRLCTVQ